MAYDSRQLAAVGKCRRWQPVSDGEWTQRIIPLLQECTNIVSPSLTNLGEEKEGERGGVKEGISQGRCRLKSCKVYSSHMCSKCTHSLDPWQKQFWFCNHTTRGGSECWKEHLRVVHRIGI
jgi:hypothetical protein